MIQSLISMMTIPIMGHLADRYGRRNITALGCVVMIMYPFVYFRLVDTRAVGLVFLAVAIGLPLHDLQYGPQAPLIAESFPGSLRYSGSSLGYQLASITAGGPMLIMAVILLREFGTSTAIAIHVSA